MRTAKITDSCHDTLKVGLWGTQRLHLHGGMGNNLKDTINGQHCFHFTLPQALRLRQALDTAIKEMERKKHDHK